jgi:very-short-patch-repair endonuclease
MKNFNYVLLSKEYNNNKDKLETICPCGHRWSVRFNNFLLGARCCYCEGNIPLSIEFVRTYLKNEGYELLSNEYTNNYTPLIMKCPNGHITEGTNWNNFKNGVRCSKCGNSKGEDKIEKWLKEFNYDYSPQYKFEDCKSIKCLPFDFYLTDMNILIEFDGEGHYKPVNWKGNKNIAFDTFVGTIIRDTIKNEYCKKNGIKLIRIPYWEYDNIEEILKCELKLDKYE